MAAGPASIARAREAAPAFAKLSEILRLPFALLNFAQNDGKRIIASHRSLGGTSG